MSKTKKVLLAVLLVVIVVIGAFVFFGRSYIRLYIAGRNNEKILSTLIEDFSDIISEYSNNGIVEIKGTYGKLNGNGNGIQYLGVALVKKEDINNIEAMIAKLEGKYEIVEFWDQENKKVESKYLEHKTIEYDTDISDSTDYITIFFFNSSHSDSDYYDIQGH